jgi:hypothetical protein
LLALTKLMAGLLYVESLLREENIRLIPTGQYAVAVSVADGAEYVRGRVLSAAFR